MNSTIKQSVYGLVHDTNGAVGTIRNYLSSIKAGRYTLDDDYMEAIKGALKRITAAVDNHYIEMKESKLWEEHLQ